MKPAQSDLPLRSQLRKQLRLARNALSVTEQQRACDAVAAQFVTHLLPTKPKRIAGYLANDGEVNLDAIFSSCYRNDIGVSLPVIHPFATNHLLFVDYQHNTPMTQNRFGISEPKVACPSIQHLDEHDLILMPLVGFDHQGNRLGMGGGFYDRTLARINQLTTPPKLIGIAHDCQHVDLLPIASWDIPLNAIITPSRFIPVSD